MRTKLQLAALLLTTVAFHAQEVVWAKQYNYISNNNDPSHIAVSVSQEPAVAGVFYSNVKTIRGHFVMKLDHAGNVQWRDTLYNHGTTGNAVTVGGLAYGLPAPGSDEPLYMAVNFSDTLERSGTTYGAPGNNSMLFKYDGAGNKTWSNFYNSAEFHDLWVTAGNDLMVLLKFQDSLNFFGQMFYSKRGGDLLFARVSSTGALLFADQLSGSNLEGISIRADNTGSISIAFARIGKKDTLSYRDSLLFYEYGNECEAFLLKTHSDGQLAAFNHYYSHIQFGDKDADISTNGYIITGIEGVFRTTSTSLKVFDRSANEINSCGRTATWFGYSDYRTADYARVAASDTNAYWTLGYEEAPGNIHDPADDKRFMMLRKFDYQCHTLLSDSFAYPNISGERDIATDAQGNIYICGELPVRHSMKFGNTILTNSDDYDQHNTIFVVRFADKQNTIGMVEQMENVALRCFPNPSTGIFTVKAGQNLEGRPYCIYNCTGQIVRTGNLLENETNIDLDHLPTGVYLMTAGHGNGQANIRLVKE